MRTLFTKRTGKMKNEQAIFSSDELLLAKRQTNPESGLAGQGTVVSKAEHTEHLNVLNKPVSLDDKTAAQFGNPVISDNQIAMVTNNDRTGQRDSDPMPDPKKDGQDQVDKYFDKQFDEILNDPNMSPEQKAAAMRRLLLELKAKDPEAYKREIHRQQRRHSSDLHWDNKTGELYLTQGGERVCVLTDSSANM